jgi:hypothetical protein
MKKIELRDKLNNNLVELRHILPLLPQYVTSLNWAILELEARGDIGEEITMSDLMEAVNNNPNGYLMDWNKLLTFSQKVFQIIDGTFVGFRDLNNRPAFKPEGALYERSEVVLELIDSTLWSIYSKDFNVLKVFDNEFKDVKFVE